MTESELLAALVRRTGVARADIEAVLTALAAVRHEQRQESQPPEADGQKASSPYVPSYTPAAGEVERLIAAAAEHPLGLEFLLEGNLCAVATMFGVHAFTVDAARQRLKEQAV